MNDWLEESITANELLIQHYQYLGGDDPDVKKWKKQLDRWKAVVERDHQAKAYKHHKND